MTTIDQLRPADHRRVAAFVAKTAGIQLPENKRSLVETRLRRRVKATGKGNFTHYLDFALSVEGVAGEQLLLIDALTTNKTDFFREAAHFDFLTDYVRGHLARHRQVGFSRSFNVWSAACSTGEEPYTLAMVLSDLSAEIPGFRFNIVASDIAPSVLDIARKGIYPNARIAPVKESLRKKYLLRSRDPAKGLVRVNKALREMVTFSSFNLITGDYSELDHYDAIFCRNVMIYFNTKDREQIINNFQSVLLPGGLLFIGHSESLGVHRQAFETLRPTVFRRMW